MLAVEIGFHAEHSQASDNTKVIEHLLAARIGVAPHGG